jgi:hypothetical protein
MRFVQCGQAAPRSDFGTDAQCPTPEIDCCAPRRALDEALQNNRQDLTNQIGWTICLMAYLNHEN